MRKIEEQRTRALLESYSSVKHGKTMPLEELCEAFHLSIKEDGDVLFSILDKHLWFSDEPQPTSGKFAWRVDKEGFRIIGDYAFAKQECLSTFQKLYRQEHIKSKKPEENKQ